MPYDVFISHSSKDKSVADAMCAALEGRGVRCWVAPRACIRPGIEWSAAIIDGIADSRVAVLIFSQHSNVSPQVLREVERAIAKGIPIIPFRIEDVPLSKPMEYHISTQHWLDALSPPLESHLTKLCDVVRCFLDKTPTSKSSHDGLPVIRTTAHSLPAKPYHLQLAAMAVAVVTVVILLPCSLGVVWWWTNLQQGRARAAQFEKQNRELNREFGGIMRSMDETTRSVQDLSDAITKDAPERAKAAD